MTPGNRRRLTWPTRPAWRAWPAWLAGLAACAALASPAPARALPPNVWDQARDPLAAKIEQGLEDADDKLDQASFTRAEMVRRQLALEARSQLEELAQQTRDVRVRLMLGRAHSLLEDDARVISTLGPALEQAPDDPASLQAFFDLAVAYARADRPKDEIATYDRLLERQTDLIWRHVALSNRAESRAKLGNLEGAIADYRESIALASDDALPRYGLAVALDRSGDLSKAIEEGMRAHELDSGDVSQLDRSGVFFVPAYEKWWYHALRQMAAAQRAQRTEERALHYERAARLWELYLAQALSSERWVPLAKARLKLCEATLARLRAPAKGAKRGGGAAARR